MPAWGPASKVGEGSRSCGDGGNLASSSSVKGVSTTQLQKSVAIQEDGTWWPHVKRY